MSIIDSRQLESNSVVRADICVVGAGAAGITLAHALDGSSQSICLLESGRYDVDADTQSLYDVIVAGHPMRADFMSRARYFGGTCNLWAGRSMKLTPMDLAAREWVPDSGWPVSYAELDRHYDEAARILKLPSFDDFRERDLHRLMSPFERALLANDDLRPTISLWARKPLRFGAAYKAALERSRTVSVYLGANAVELLPNPAGDAVEALAVATLGGTRLTVRAKRFVLACGGLENARLLLVSRRVHARGIGNAHDVVGRFFMDHPRAVFGRVRVCGSQRLPLLLGTPLRDGIGQVGIQLSDGVQRREGLLNGYVTLERQWSPRVANAYASFLRAMKILLRKGYAGTRAPFSDAKLARIPDSIYLVAPRALVPHGVYRMVRAARNAFGTPVTEVAIVNYCEQAPNRESRVYLSDQRDRLNMQRLVVDWNVGAAENHTLLRLHALLDMHLRTNRLGQLVGDRHGDPGIRYDDASHHMGTTRMSDDARTGVVDRNCRVHGMQNVFVAGSSVFPTCGHANPTWTIVALTLRLAEWLRQTR